MTRRTPAHASPSGSHAERTCAEPECGEPLKPNQPRFCGKSCANATYQREWRQREAWRRIIRSFLDLEDCEAQKIVASVVDRDSYLRALELCAKSRLVQIRYRAIGGYGTRFKGEIARWIETGVSVDREVYEAFHEDELRAAAGRPRHVNIRPAPLTGKAARKCYDVDESTEKRVTVFFTPESPCCESRY